MREIWLRDILTCTRIDSSILESRFELKPCLINQINKRWHTIGGTQLHEIDILIYHMHKYVRDINLLLKFELLYDIEFFIKMEGWIIAKVWL